MSAGPLVVGLGSLDRGDDAVGPLVAREVARAGLPGVHVVEHEDPTALLDVWAGHDPVVVVDAVFSGWPPGSLHCLEAGAGRPPIPDAAWARTGRGGTHAFGAAAAIELARALGRLPARLVVVGVEAGSFDYGAPLTEPVADAVDAAVATVIDVVGCGTVPEAGRRPEGWGSDVPR